jgi:hypothetical protein
VEWFFIRMRVGEEGGGRGGLGKSNKPPRPWDPLRAGVRLHDERGADIAAHCNCNCKFMQVSLPTGHDHASIL